MDHHGDGFELHAKQDDMETFDFLKEIKKLFVAKLALPPIEEMRMTFPRKNCHHWRNSNLGRPGEEMDSSTVPEVHRLAKSGSLKNLMILISKDGVESAWVKTNNGQTVLHLAASGGHVRICEFLIYKLQFDVNVKDSMGCTPLHEAASGNHLEAVYYLIHHGADLNALTSTGLTALHVAAEAGSLYVIPHLISQGLDVNSTSDLGTPLSLAAIQNQEGAMITLLHLMANPNIFPDGMLSPLHISILTRSHECVNELLLAGADPNIKSCKVSPFEAAIKCGDKTIVKMLLNAGAIPTIMDDHGLMPLELAAVEKNHAMRKAAEVYSLYELVGQKAYEAGKCHTSFDWYTKEAVACLEEIQNYDESKSEPSLFEEMKMLLRAKLAVIRSRNSNPQSPDSRTVGDICTAVRCGDIAKLRLLVSKLSTKTVRLLSKVRVDTRYTILHFAASGGHTQICKYLILELKFDINIRDYQGLTPLHFAAMGNHTETLLTLIAHGADLNAITPLGENALHVAAEEASLDTMRLLISRGFDVNAPSDSGVPLCSAAKDISGKAVQFLLSKGAKPNEVPEGVHSPLYVAITSESYKCMELLLVEGKADPNIKSFGSTPLETAIKCRDIRALELLLRHGADPNERVEYGITPLELAVLKKNKGMVKKLFCRTIPIHYIEDWSVDGVRMHCLSKEVKRQIRLKAERLHSLYDTKGQNEYRAGRYQAASVWYTWAIDRNRHGARVYLKRSLCFVQLNCQEVAMSDALSCLYFEREPHSDEAMCAAVLAMVSLEDLERAFEQIEEICKKLHSDQLCPS